MKHQWLGEAARAMAGHAADPHRQRLTQASLVYSTTASGYLHRGYRHVEEHRATIDIII